MRVLLNFEVTFFLPKQSWDLVQRLIGKLGNYSRSAQRDFNSTALGKLNMSPHTSKIFSKKSYFPESSLCRSTPCFKNIAHLWHKVKDPVTPKFNKTLTTRSSILFSKQGLRHMLLGQLRVSFLLAAFGTKTTHE